MRCFKPFFYCFFCLICTLFINISYATQKSYASIDRYVYHTPPDAEETLEKLVAYLSNPVKGFSYEESTARAIYIWIVANIQYDYYDYKQRTRKQDYPFELFNHNVFETRIGVCADIASLYKKMATMAGLKAEYISGTAHTGEGHAWNSVLIDGKSCFLDATWDLKTNNSSLVKIKNDKRYQKEIQKQLNKTSKQKKPSLSARQKHVKTVWYCVPPKAFLRTHKPNKLKQLNF